MIVETVGELNVEVFAEQFAAMVRDIRDESTEE